MLAGRLIVALDCTAVHHLDTGVSKPTSMKLIRLVQYPVSVTGCCAVSCEWAVPHLLFQSDENVVYQCDCLVFVCQRAT